MALAPRIVLVHRRTEYEELLDRHATRGQAEFFLASRGRDIAEVEQRHHDLTSRIREVLAGLPKDVRRTQVERGDLDRYQFAPEDIVVIVGQDGLVANVAKYVDGNPVIGINPEPERNPGSLVRYSVKQSGRIVGGALRGSLRFEERTMVEARLDDGQHLVALNEIYVGDRGHQSSRYSLTLPTGERERQSSSGIIVSTATGGTGWASSLANDRQLVERVPGATSTGLLWWVREAWPSRWTGRNYTNGALEERQRLRVLVESDSLVAFGDGIEADNLRLGWGQTLTIEHSARVLRLA
ncbi:hypothetical protein [Salinibacterium sp.]|uniref:hypothetical protein n=1 Tax=Salinibacterium sp. TaxID=1915057 RepID=UPI00286CD8CF|nr:hypothetical protein [Salinibacterium sp.]